MLDEYSQYLHIRPCGTYRTQGESSLSIDTSGKMTLTELPEHLIGFQGSVHPTLSRDLGPALEDLWEAMTGLSEKFPLANWNCYSN